MKIIEHLVYKFFQEEYVNTGIIIALNLIKVILKINGISFITANIIRGIEQKNYKSAHEYFNYFIGISFLFIFFYAITNFLQNGLLVKMTQWVKREVLKIIFMTNNENFSDVNFIEFITPITRISASSYIIFSTILLWLLPTFSFLFIIAIYFLYKNTNLGLFFVLANILLSSYIYYFWDSLLEKKTDQEKIINENEKYIINLLNNIDKVIYRGQTINEMNTYKDKTDKCIDVTNSFFKTINIHSLLLNIFIHITIFICIGYMIYLCIQKKMDATIFITFFTIILFYRDTMGDVLHEIPTILEFTGRMVYIINEFKTMLGNNEEVTDLKIYDNISLNFDNIRFENISYLYPGTDKYIFKNTDLTMNTQDKIIGITGLSGNGKSTLAKLLIKMYKPNDGNIFIDDVNIEDIDPQYIRENITYVNQNSKLFDKVVVDNMLYGCNDVDKCKSHLDEIMKYPKIVKLYRDVDLYSKKTGSLGERISGGQRQIVNVINGLINPTQILILDEPTNALDIDLKRELIGIIQEFKKYKKCIIIISHDKDIFPLFDEKIDV